MHAYAWLARLAHQNLPKHAYLNKRLKKFSAEGLCPLTDPALVGRGTSHPALTRHLRRLVALPKLNVWIRHWSPATQKNYKRGKDENWRNWLRQEREPTTHIL